MGWGGKVGGEGCVEICFILGWGVGYLYIDFISYEEFVGEGGVSFLVFLFIMFMEGFGKGIGNLKFIEVY